jgi:hypothetical protein
VNTVSIMRLLFPRVANSGGVDNSTEKEYNHFQTSSQELPTASEYKPISCTNLLIMRGRR